MNRTILVTGASKGIGRAIAARLGRDGYTVVVHYHADREGAEATLADLRAAGGQGRLTQFDTSDRAGTREALEADMEANGPYWGVVLNAGISRDAAFPALTDEDWDSVLGVNLTAAFRLSRACLKGMLRKRHGRIIGISSIVGVTGNAGQGNYAAAKAGMIGMYKSLAAEVASRNVTVNCIAPGFMESPMTDALNEKQKAAILATVPMGRLGTGAEVAAAVVYLASSQASYVTGQTLHVNGGMAMI